MSKQAAQIKDLTMELNINAPAAKVWDALTSNIGLWWPAEFYAGGTAGARTYTLEDWPGGRMFESWESGGGVLWGNVVTVEPEVRLQVCGTTFPNWGGPQQWFGTWELSASENGTTLRYSESTVGRISDAANQEKDKGWRFLWATLKAHVEGAPPPVWVD